ncbi:MAG: nucleoside kinase [Spirochaetales bacterium]|nr:nucleoside kinase [Spirochaetales bacterium]
MKVAVRFPSGRSKEYQAGTIVRDIICEEEFSGTKYPVIAARVNNEITSFTYKIVVNSEIHAVRLDSREGTNIYRRSLCFLLSLTAKKLFPERRLIISHSLGKGFFYYFEGLDCVSERDIDMLLEHMKAVVASDLPVTRRLVSYTDAVDYFRKNNQPDTVKLLAYRNDSRIPVNECGEFLDISHGPLVPSTGFLKVFDIINYQSGFLLRYFGFGNPGKIQRFKDNPVLFSIYREYKSWGKILNAHCVGALNELISSGKIKEFIQVAEALHNKKISEIADRIQQRGKGVRLIAIAGPTSSGKTTFAKKLAIQLRVLGMTPVQLSIDNYFLSREETPRDDEGNYNFETLDALDILLFNRHLKALLEGREVEVPDYNFILGRRQNKGTPLKLPEKGILICEGIHFLNDRLTSLVKPEMKYKIYVSALTQLNLDDHNRISTTDNRLIRRMVRDNTFRGYTAGETLKMWQSVKRGESINIFPFQNSSDSAFNSALDYELAVLKVYAEPLLKTVKPDVEEYNEAKRLLSFLTNFIPITSQWVPSESILREFIGGSAFRY